MDQHLVAWALLAGLMVERGICAKREAVEQVWQFGDMASNFEPEAEEEGVAAEAAAVVLIVTKIGLRLGLQPETEPSSVSFQ